MKKGGETEGWSKGGRDGGSEGWRKVRIEGRNPSEAG